MYVRVSVNGVWQWKDDKQSFCSPSSVLANLPAFSLPNLVNSPVKHFSPNCAKMKQMSVLVKNVESVGQTMKRRYSQCLKQPLVKESNT